MRKRFAILLSVIMVLSVTALTACGGVSGGDPADSPYLGTWVATNITLGDNSGDLGGQITLVLNDDGTGVMTAVSEENGTEESDFTWTPTNDGFKTQGDLKATFEEEDGGIETKILGVAMHFVRPDAGQAEGDASASDLTDPVNGALYGYAGDNPAEAAVYQYLVETIAPQYDLPEGAVSIPIVSIIDEEIDTDDGDAEIKGDFWVFNYVVEGDTLKMVSGGNHPGKMELIEVGSGFTVKEMEPVGDGSEFETTAKDIFEEKYDEFMKVNGDEQAREKLRAETIADFVKANGLNVTKYQDEGWDPIDIPL